MKKEIKPKTVRKKKRDRGRGSGDKWEESWRGSLSDIISLFKIRIEIIDKDEGEKKNNKSQQLEINSTGAFRSSALRNIFAVVTSSP